MPLFGVEALGSTKTDRPVAVTVKLGTGAAHVPGGGVADVEAA